MTDKEVVDLMVSRYESALDVLVYFRDHAPNEGHKIMAQDSIDMLMQPVNGRPFRDLVLRQK